MADASNASIDWIYEKQTPLDIGQHHQMPNTPLRPRATPGGVIGTASFQYFLSSFSTVFRLSAYFFRGIIFLSLAGFSLPIFDKPVRLFVFAVRRREPLIAAALRRSSRAFYALFTNRWHYIMRFFALWVSRDYRAFRFGLYFLHNSPASLSYRLRMPLSIIFSFINILSTLSRYGFEAAAYTFDFFSYFRWYFASDIWHFIERSMMLRSFRHAFW